MAKKLIALDWNGTLLDDLDAHVKAHNDFMHLVGVHEAIDAATYQEQFEIPIENFVAKRHGDVAYFKRHTEELAHRFHVMVDMYSEDCKLRPGVSAFLSWANEQPDLRVIIFSNHIDTLIDKELNRQGISAYFNAQSIICNSESHAINHRRGKGEKLAEYMKREGFAAEDVLVVGDTEEEADIAHDLGAHAVLVKGGYNSERRLREAAPETILDSVEDLRGVVASLWKLNP